MPEKERPLNCLLVVRAKRDRAISLIVLNKTVMLFHSCLLDITLLAECFFLATPLACTMSFASPVFRVAGLFKST